MALRAGHLVDSSLIAKSIATSSMAIYSSPEYLAARGTPQRLEELVSHDCLVFGTTPERKWHFERNGRTHEVSVTGRIAAQDFGYLRFATLAGGGIALLPNMLVGPDVHHGRLVQLLSDFTHAQDTLYVVYPSRNFLPAKTRAFVDFITERMGRLGGHVSSEAHGVPRCNVPRLSDRVANVVRREDQAGSRRLSRSSATSTTLLPVSTETEPGFRYGWALATEQRDSLACGSQSLPTRSPSATATSLASGVGSIAASRRSTSTARCRIGNSPTWLAWCLGVQRRGRNAKSSGARSHSPIQPIRAEVPGDAP